MSKKAGSVRSVDIAHFLDVTKPSVSRDAQIARSQIYSHGTRRHDHFTSEGLKLCAHTSDMSYYAPSDHLGVDEETADKDACVRTLL